MDRCLTQQQPMWCGMRTEVGVIRTFELSMMTCLCETLYSFAATLNTLVFCHKWSHAYNEYSKYMSLYTSTTLPRKAQTSSLRRRADLGHQHLLAQYAQ